MPDPQISIDAAQELALRTEYEARRTKLETLAEKIRVACEALLHQAGLPFHSLKSRVKSLPSTIDKIVRKGYKPSLDHVKDLVGIRVISLYPRHIDPILELLQSQFTVHEKVDKRPGTSPTQFGYSSVHLVCTVRDTPRAALPEYAGLENIPFEIQTRTILQEAWAEIEHQLVYKSEVAAPDQIKRLILRLSGNLEIADEQFQDIYDLRQTYIQKLKEADVSQLRDEPLNVDSLLAVIRKKYPWAEGWEEICIDTLETYLTRLVADMHSLGITTVRQLISLIDNWYDTEYEKSARGYRIAKSVERPTSSDDAGYLIIGNEEWHDRTQHYFFPIAQLRGILEREHPGYKDQGPWPA